MRTLLVVSSFVRRDRFRRLRAALVVVLAMPTLLLAGCAAAGSGGLSERPFAQVTGPDIIGAHYRAVRVHGDAPALTGFGAHGLTVWFEQENGRMTLIADGPVNTWNMPVHLRSDAITPDPEHEAVSAVGCAKASSACAADAWVGRFIAKPMTYTVDGTALVITGGRAEVDLQRI